MSRNASRSHSITADVNRNPVAILDAGAQYGKVIDRRVRSLLIGADMLPLDTPYQNLNAYEAFILSGGPDSVYARNAPKPDPRVFSSGKPILGICYGLQLINQAFGGTVDRTQIREDGQCLIAVDPDCMLFDGLESEQEVLMSHGDSISQVAPGFRATAESGKIIAGIADESRKVFGVQFHPEVDLTPHGIRILSNFLFLVANLRPTYTVQSKLRESLRYIKETVGTREVLAFASGGVDSTVCCALIAKVIPKKRIHAIHVNTGFMRYEESEAVQQALSAAGISVEVIDAAEQFRNAITHHNGKLTPPLCRVTDPEVKRSIIGDTFMRIVEQATAELKLDPKHTVLAQGTLRPDLIESASLLASTKAAVIKTHHNDTHLVRQLRASGGVVEPLQQLHKDEVRELGESLGLPTELVWRQPFPGPGLAIRVLCAEKPYITKEYETVSRALKEFEDSDIAVHLLPVRTVGVQGDGRTYSYLVALSGTADWPRLVAKAKAIPKKIHKVNRVVYLFGDKLTSPVRDITPTYLTPEVVEQLRQADAVVNNVLRTYGLEGRLSQVPVVSFPVHFGQPGNRSIGIRAFITNDFMTGVPALPDKDLPGRALTDMVSGILGLPGVSRVAYDITSKPPGTTEWE